MRRRLAENKLKPWQRKMWCIPKVDAEFVARMEDVLDLHAKCPNRKRPVICFDETPTQLIGEARVPIPAQPGQIPSSVAYCSAVSPLSFQRSTRFCHSSRLVRIPRPPAASCSEVCLE